MIVHVRMFAVLREAVGQQSVELELAVGATVADAIETLSQDNRLAPLLDRVPLAVAVNRDYADRSTNLRAGDEVALIPPVSGGASAHGADVHVRVVSGPLSIDALSRAVSRRQSGATVVFEGTTRDVEYLDYEAYAEMAEVRMSEILAECKEKYGLAAAAAEHRIGRVPLGEASVIVAVSAAHRAEAFAGAREAIDRLKQEAPIWKCEVERGTRTWVEGTPAPKAGVGSKGERSRSRG